MPYPLIKIYGQFLRQSDWYPSKRTPGNMIMSGPYRTMVCREGYGSTRWYGSVGCTALSPLIRYTDFYKTIEEAKEAAIEKTREWFLEVLVPNPEPPRAANENENLDDLDRLIAADAELKAHLARR